MHHFSTPYRLTENEFRHTVPVIKINQSINENTLSFLIEKILVSDGMNETEAEYSRLARGPKEQV